MNKAYKKLAAGTLSLCMLAGMGSAFAAAIPSQNKNMQLTAKVEVPAPTYTVTIPESTNLGTLSAEKDNVSNYTVSVSDVANLNGGKVTVTASAGGDLISGANKLAYTNDFGAKTTDVNAEWTGSIKVTAAAVKDAKAGDYTGTVNFTVAYEEPAAPEVPEAPETGMDAPALVGDKYSDAYRIKAEVYSTGHAYVDAITAVSVNGIAHTQATGWWAANTYKIDSGAIMFNATAFTEPVNTVVITSPGYKTLTLQINKADGTIVK